jgi:CubicO group peptidase (beta-lactamase class C family)
MGTHAQRWMVTLALAALGAGATAAQSGQPAVQPGVDAIFKRWTRATPGCAVGAMVKGAPVVSAAYGMADLEHDVPIAPDTIFEAGSVSKQFTAAAVLLLARDGKLSLDDSVRTYIPELPDFGVPLTIRHLLNHTSGLRDWGSLAAIAGWPRGFRVHTHAHVLEILSRQRALNFPPGTRWSYSNSGYNLAAMLVARVSGTPFAEFSRTRLFEPLGMRDTSWRDDYTRIVKRRAIAYSDRQGTFVTDMPFENVHGNGGLLTTVADLLKWNENFTAPKVGDAAFKSEMERPLTFNDGRSHEYALGLYVDTHKGVREVDHSGATAGYRAHLVRYPEQRVSVAVLCNVGSAAATTYAKAVGELFLINLREAAAPVPAHMLTAAEGARLAGLYRSEKPAGVARVAHDQNGLRIQGVVGPLVPASGTRFTTTDSATYEFDGSGTLRATDEFGTTDVFDRVQPAAPTAEQLSAYAGRYVSDEIETTLTVQIEDARLVIKRRPDTTIALTPVYADGFSSALGWIVFRRDAAGRIVSLSVNQDRVWDLTFARAPDGTGAPTRAPR